MAAVKSGATEIACMISGRTADQVEEGTNGTAEHTTNLRYHIGIDEDHQIWTEDRGKTGRPGSREIGQGLMNRCHHLGLATATSIGSHQEIPDLTGLRSTFLKAHPMAPAWTGRVREQAVS